MNPARTHSMRTRPVAGDVPHEPHRRPHPQFAFLTALAAVAALGSATSCCGNESSSDCPDHDAPTSSASGAGGPNGGGMGGASGETGSAAGTSPAGDAGGSSRAGSSGDYAGPCSEDADCTHAFYDRPVSSDADCYCPDCPDPEDATIAILRSVHDEYTEQWEEHCTAWEADNPCFLVPCTLPPPVLCSDSGQCELGSWPP